MITTNITKACSKMHGKYPGQFIPDEDNSRIIVRMEYFSATIKVKPYTFESKIVATLRKCAKTNNDRLNKERAEFQNKLF